MSPLTEECIEKFSIFKELARQREYNGIINGLKDWNYLPIVVSTGVPRDEVWIMDAGNVEIVD